jgi:hypothetical protein
MQLKESPSTRADFKKTAILAAHPQLLANGENELYIRKPSIEQEFAVRGVGLLAATQGD